MGLVRMLFTLAAAVSASASETALAASPDALLRGQIEEACITKKGKIDPASVFNRDLTGDGKADLLIHHHGIECSDGSRSIFCGMQACSIAIYVHTPSGLTATGDFMGVEHVRITDGKVPTIHTVAHGGKPVRIRWNGRAFVGR